MTLPPGRYEKRTAATVAVMLTSRESAFSTELALTENISERGARVLTRKLWWANESVVIKSLEGDLQSEARIVYRQPVRENVYAIGLELLGPKGTWRGKSG
jgi:hypothetical protein